MAVTQVLLAEPRGFCAGVQMAIKALSWITRICEPPVYCNHEIVHNKAVVAHFRERGVVFVDDITEIPDGAAVMLSAHGSAPEVVDYAREHGGISVNAVCPLVTKVHHEMKLRARKGYSIIYVGHRGHQEAIGTMAVAPDAAHMVETVDDVTALGDIAAPIALLTQTTLSQDDWSAVRAAVRERFDDVWMPARSDLCYATTNRQAALREIAARADAIVVVGSENSSNTKALMNVTRGMGVTRVLRVNHADELDDSLAGIVGVTAGASAPEAAVAHVIERLAPTHGVEVVSAVDEDEYFPPPRELRDLLDAIHTATLVSLGAALLPGQSPLSDDRDQHAENALYQV